MGNVVRGLVPRWGRGGAWQNPPCQSAVPNHNSGFSYLGVPAPAGMSDCYEKIDRSGSLSFAIRGIPSPIRPPIRHSGGGRNPEGVGRGKATNRWKKLNRTTIFILLCGLRKAMVIPAKAGIQRGGDGKCSAVEDYARRAASPPQGSGPGMAETPVRTHPTKPQLQVFIPWCTGASRHERLVRKWCYGPLIATLKPTNPRNRHSRAGGNPRTNLARQHVN